MKTDEIIAALPQPAPRLAAQQRRQIQHLLHQVFGLERLRPGQQAVLDNVLAGRDTLALMPTGSGKSLCYQLPAAMLDGTVVVVSPLIALMQDQADKLQDTGLDAAQLNSSLARAEEAAALDSIRGRRSDIVFCTPERLATPEFLQLLRHTPIALLVVDEAHCISQWGHDFRPAYLEIGAARAALGHPPVLALTATATDEVVADIARQLDAPGLHVVNTGIYRANLHYRVIQSTNPREKLALALEIVRETAGAGIVYAATVKAAEEVHALLREAGESVACYHGKLRAAERRQNQQAFMDGACRVLVATNAFGMGIDKPDIRFVLHVQIPATLEAYYQESGRAGRDGAAAACTLLYLHEDKRVQQYFLARAYPSAVELRQVHEAVLAQPAGRLADLKAALPGMGDLRLKVCLKLLKDGQLLRQNRQLSYMAGKAAATAALFGALAAGYEQKQERDRAALEQMVGYAQSGYCRWKLLLDYFGDETAGVERCGVCDNCLAPPQVQPLPGEREERMPASAAVL
ncbi:RecQ family ATP-dependent DNA helicase [Massilia sp. MB5]|uniref:RecQ family ATP-dependent DNA helicase n=1 Tax=Massilia sp. MB5 TaxID=2919578 RepID=UPI001F0E4278|nr:RecQ family ATP-dependent DNA helicase [Massilia sp. MB5]UMR30620.1 RecQ family ATP-dependent DNA helicase [Massilia sp. MB5]